VYRPLPDGGQFNSALLVAVRSRRRRWLIMAAPLLIPAALLVLGHIVTMAAPDAIDSFFMSYYMRSLYWVWELEDLVPLALPYLLLPVLFLSALHYGSQLRFSPELLAALPGAEVHLHLRHQVRGAAYLLLAVGYVLPVLSALGYIARYGVDPGFYVQVFATILCIVIFAAELAGFVALRYPRLRLLHAAAMALFLLNGLSAALHYGIIIRAPDGALLMWVYLALGVLLNILSRGVPADPERFVEERPHDLLEGTSVAVGS
jgi:hypothetical protein